MFVEDTRLWHVLSVSTYIYIYIGLQSVRSEPEYNDAANMNIAH